ncbi:MAG: hypothetical protein ACXWTY_01295 [Methylobacter sp.]
MKKIKKPLGFGYFLVVISLPLLSVFFLYLEHITHYEFLLHIAAIPLEILVGGILVERYLAWREKRRRARQLMFIKSCLFRSELRTLYMTNFEALAYPKISMKDIKGAGPKELKEWLKQVEENARYRSPEAMEAVIMEYVNAYLSFNRFLEWAIANDFERIFHDMIMLMHFIHDAQLFKTMHPNELFINKALKNPEQMERVKAVLSDGIKSFLKFCIELQEQEPDVFLTLMEDYMFAFPMQPESWKSKLAACAQAENTD